MQIRTVLEVHYKEVDGHVRQAKLFSNTTGIPKCQKLDKYCVFKVQKSPTDSHTLELTNQAHEVYVGLIL